MIIDIHSHILPGLDDGSENMNESIKMLRIAIKEGIEAIILTPHYEVGVDSTWLEDYQNAYYKLYKYIVNNKLPMKLFVGNELFYSEGVIEKLLEKKASTLNDTKYILVEFPIYLDFDNIKRAVLNLQYSGFWPILAHVERYISLEDVKRIKELVELGAYIQVNASTVIGKAGLSKRMYISKLIKENLVHFIATDAHGSSFRRPLIRDAYNYITKKYSEHIAKKLFKINPGKVLKGERICG